MVKKMSSRIVTAVIKRMSSSLSDNIKTGDQLHTIKRVALDRIANSLETIARVMTIALSSAIGIGVGCFTSAAYK
jgi:hypothetical protein